MITIGIMTGNSLDAADAVMTEFGARHKIRDIAGVSIPYPMELKENMLGLRGEMQLYGSDMAKVSKLPLFQSVLKDYTALLVKTVEELILKSGVKREDVAAIGLHGQSVGEHNPPSVAGNGEAFTTQIFDAAGLAQKTKIAVIYDFRSDDIFDGGEGAPLAPIHQLHLSYELSQRGHFPVAFINGGNTANLAVISTGKTLRKQVVGYDIGAFNHYVDMLAAAFYHHNCDEDGCFGAGGCINLQLLEELYRNAAKTEAGENFYELMPPKSAGPHLYKMSDRLVSYTMAKEDIMRTVEYFSAYGVFLGLRFIPEDLDFPHYFLMFGGGWRNPLIYRDFISLLNGRGLVLDEHIEIAEKIRNRLRDEKFYVGMSDDFGINAQYMEARIMADLAYCYLEGKAFTAPETTGCRTGRVLGIMCKPGENLRRRGRGFSYSRAAKGWSTL